MHSSESVISNKKKRNNFPIEEHECQDFAKHLRRYGWFIRGSIAKGCFEVVSPDGEHSLDDSNLLKNFESKWKEKGQYTKLVQAFVSARCQSAKKKQRRNSTRMISIDDAMGNSTPKRKSSVLEIPPKTAPKRKCIICVWPECSSSSVCVNKKNEPRCNKHRYGRPCEMDGCTSEARAGGDFPNRCGTHGGGWRCEHPECNKGGKRRGGGKRTCSDHRLWGWNEGSSSSSEEEEKAGERHKDTAAQAKGKDDSTGSSSSSEEEEEVGDRHKDTATDSQVEAKGKDDSTSKNTTDPGLSASSSTEIEKQRKGAAAAAETKDKDDSTSKKEGNVQLSAATPDTLSSIPGARKHTADCINKVVHCKRRMKELEVQLKEVKNSSNDDIRNKKDMLAARAKARENVNRENVRVKNMEQHFKTAEETFEKALIDTAGVGRLATCHNNVSQCLKDLTEAKLELYKLQENLSNHEHTLAALKPRVATSQGKVSAAEQVLSESKTELRAAIASLRKARDQEARLVDTLLAEC